ncbi:hypothetical protein [Nocardia veterana]|uniref:Restriction endonuclease n=1 Tax=Nocardia veterana TaxID=132249 RepID=A0A7X6LUR8_9NOCA|nr:hypothetical protein [Nocardia veterana]NKY84419.1 restriction endonuclease [Nocardia veterana]
MARVPWGDLEGDDVERFIAAMILLDHPGGTRITPAQGDGGVDIKVPNGDGFDVYQVKKYVSAPTSRQVKSIEDSWARVNTSFGSTNKITGWFLTMPWGPTEKREKWLKDELAKDATFPVQWFGREHLDGMCSRHRSLVELFFEDGVEKINKLLASLTALTPRAQGVTEAEGLEVFAARYLQLQEELDKISPFYQYRLTLVPAEEVPTPPAVEGRSLFTTGASLENYRRVSDRYFVRTTVSVVSVEAEEFNPSPMRVDLQLPVGDDNREDLQAFVDYGIAPPEPVTARVTAAVGPPGVSLPLGDVIVHLPDQTVPSPWESLALHLMPASEEERQAEITPFVEVVDIVTTEGAAGRNMTGTAGAIGVDLTIKLDPPALRLNTWQVPIAGQLPHRILASLWFAKFLWSGEYQVGVGIPCGPALVEPQPTPRRSQDAQAAEDWAMIAQHIMTAQRWCAFQLKVPESVTGAELDMLQRAAALTEAEGPIERDWETLRVVQHNPDVPMTGESELIAFAPFTIQLDGHRIELDATVEERCDRVEAIESGPGYVVVRPVGGAPVRERLVAKNPNYDGRVLTRRITPQDPDDADPSGNS